MCILGHYFVAMKDDKLRFRNQIRHEHSDLSTSPQYLFPS